jgi:hypothetical protein
VFEVALIRLPPQLAAASEAAAAPLSWSPPGIPPEAVGAPDRRPTLNAPRLFEHEGEGLAAHADVMMASKTPMLLGS